MPIEIKELDIKITVQEDQQKSKPAFSNREIVKIKAEIIKDCTSKILQQLKQNQRR